MSSSLHLLDALIFWSTASDMRLALVFMCWTNFRARINSPFPGLRASGVTITGDNRSSMNLSDFSTRDIPSIAEADSTVGLFPYLRSVKGV